MPWTIAAENCESSQTRPPCGDHDSRLPCAGGGRAGKRGEGCRGAALPGSRPRGVCGPLTVPMVAVTVCGSAPRGVRGPPGDPVRPLNHGNMPASSSGIPGSALLSHRLRGGGEAAPQHSPARVRRCPAQRCASCLPGVRVAAAR